MNLGDSDSESKPRSRGIFRGEGLSDVIRQVGGVEEGCDSWADAIIKFLIVPVKPYCEMESLFPFFRLERHRNPSEKNQLNRGWDRPKASKLREGSRYLLMNARTKTADSKHKYLFGSPPFVRLAFLSPLLLRSS